MTDCGQCGRFDCKDCGEQANLIFGRLQQANRPVSHKSVSATRAAGRDGPFPPPTIKPAPCLHVGGNLTGTDKIRLGLGVLKTFTACDHPEKPLGPIVCGCQGCGPKCKGYEGEATGPIIYNITGLVAERHTENCSLLPWKGKLLLCYRVGWQSANIRLVELDANYAAIPGTDRPLLPIHPHCAGGQEDPRLFVFDGRLHVIFVGVRRTSPTNSTAIARQLIARLDDNGNVEHVWEPDYPDSNLIEKNWQPFEWDGGLYAVYSMAPWRVLKLENGGASAIGPDSSGIAWGNGFCRGGAAPVRVGGEYYAFFHGMQLTGHQNPEARYTMGACVFEAKPPFRPLRMTKVPLLSPDDAERPVHKSHPGGRWYVSNLYVCGSYVDAERERWIISAGYQDHWCRVAEFSFADVESALSLI